MSDRVGVHPRPLRVFSLARRLLTDRLTPPPPPQAYISISDKTSVRPRAPTSRLTAVARSPRAPRIAEDLGHHRHDGTVLVEAVRGAIYLSDAGGADDGVHLGAGRGQAGGN